MSKLRISPFFKQCFVTAAVCSTTIGHGSVVGFPAILLPQLKRPDSHIKLTEEEGSWIASVTAITLLLGSFLAPPIMGKLGRRVAHFVVIANILIGWTVILLAKSLEAMIVGRIIHGLSFGLMLPLRSVLLGEYTSPKNRGAFLTTVSVAQAFGILLVHLIGSLVSWQKTVFIVLAFPLASLLMTFFTPETPSWLAAKGRYDDCRKVFRWLRGDGEEQELEEMIRARCESNRATISNFKDLPVLLKKKEFYKPIVIMIHSYMMGEFSGGALLSCYSTTVITLLVGPEVDPHFWMIALDIQRNISNVTAVYVVHKIKRRTMFMATGSLCILSNIAIACYVYAKVLGVMTYTAIWLPILLINIQFFTVAVGMVCLPYVIAGEIFPLEYRSVGSSISIISIASGYFLVTKTFPAMIASIGLHGSYAVYAGIMCYNFIIIMSLLPETKGKTLQQIEDYFRGKPSKAEDIEVRQNLKGKTDIEKLKDES
ncbi:facilitated trehalose transporter Tret1-like [Trichoplusia ni]|uniref:Facilitated trehalose transporter Tret1-like n=1 Tax=Trichoplusia ni TaxID=7111 RepID=A0A7E5VQN6_TRINI|nr:facilitated trehalose transporter Tret1-like [Trichoplusia ni]